jgi:phenylpropionate dioxygenase-like ring-hydroxylating dioxygenase large terminal subunit
MIQNQWYVVLNSRQVKTRPVGVTRMGEKLVFWRDQEGKVNCAFDRCPHRGAQLSAGKIHNGALQCPFHGFEYDSSGQCILIPATGVVSKPPRGMRLKSYPTFEDHGFIWLWWGENPPEDLQPPPFFNNLDDSFTYGSIIDPWNAHYSRAVENQLDVAHLPFVHHNTIGRGGRTLVDGPVVEWCEDDQKMMCTYVFNRVDDGTKPRTADQLSPRQSQVHLELILPNLWQNYISEDVRILAAFVPVDKKHTLIYLRFYQKFVALPLLGKVVAQLAMPFNLRILRQDRRVVETQEPKASGMRIGEKPIAADIPIVTYRKQRQKLQEQAK